MITPISANPNKWTRAGSFAYCERLVRRTGSNFIYAFHLLPRRQKRAMEVLYAFMRLTDDLADSPAGGESNPHQLRAWRERLGYALEGEYHHPVFPAIHAVVQEYYIPSKYLYAVIDGVEMDLQPRPFETFEDLYAYCYLVASAVGLACIHIWGYHGEAEPLAEEAGIAFQLTNILRDLGEDVPAGRVYLPRQELKQFGCSPEDWRRHERNDAFRALMKFQVDRARDYYEHSWRLSDHLYPSGRAIFRVMWRTYRDLLEQIEARDYDVFERRPRVSGWRKMRFLLGALPVRWGWWPN